MMMMTMGMVNGMVMTMAMMITMTMTVLMLITMIFSMTVTTMSMWMRALQAPKQELQCTV